VEKIRAVTGQPAAAAAPWPAGAAEPAAVILDRLGREIRFRKISSRLRRE